MSVQDASDINKILCFHLVCWPLKVKNNMFSSLNNSMYAIYLTYMILELFGDKTIDGTWQKKNQVQIILELFEQRYRNINRIGNKTTDGTFHRQSCANNSRAFSTR